MAKRQFERQQAIRCYAHVTETCLLSLVTWDCQVEHFVHIVYCLDHNNYLNIGGMAYDLVLAGFWRGGLLSGGEWVYRSLCEMWLVYMVDTALTIDQWTSTLATHSHIDSPPDVYYWYSDDAAADDDDDGGC